MPASSRTPRLSRVVVTGLIALSAVTFTGAGVPATAAQLPPYRVEPGVVLRPALVLPVRSYHLTGRFGDRSSLWATVHTGLDFAAPTGTPIRSVAAGVVTQVGYDGPYGNRTVVRLADGTELWYCHQSVVSVRVGEQVAAGQRIGAIGATGNVTGPHLHLEVRPTPTVPVDPFAWLRAHGLQP